MKSKLLLMSLILFPMIGNAAGVPTSFTYQGKALNAAGTAPLTSTVSFTLSITDPSSACVLYQESQTNVNLATTNGIFALQVGSAIGATKRVAGTDPGLSMTTVFANAGTQLVSSNGSCPGYTPASNDVRKLHVVITPSAGSPITVSPDLTINSVPNAMVAETLQGQTPAQMIPAGSILNFSGLTCPTGYVLANGSTLSATTYSSLASVYVNGSNYLYGGTVASGNFTLPDFRGIFLRGAGSNGQISAANGSAFSGTLGTYQTDMYQGHLTQLYGNAGSGNVNGTASVSGTSGNGFNSGPNSIGDGTNGNPRYGAETRPANLAVTYCIKY
jgi:hypothetical protein